MYIRVNVYKSSAYKSRPTEQETPPTKPNKLQNKSDKYIILLS